MSDKKPAAVHADDLQPIGPAAAAMNILLAALWGGTPVAVSFSVDQLPPMAVSGIRFGLAALFMLFWCRFEGCELRLKRSQFVPTLVMGLLLFLQISTFTKAIAESSSSHSTVLINIYVLWVAGIEHFVTKTMRLTPVKILGLAFAAVGGLIIFAATENTGSESVRDPATRWGDFIMLGSAFILGIKVVYTKLASRVVPPGTLIFWHDVIGVAMFAAWSACFETVSFTGLHVPTILGLLYQGVVVAGFCFAVQALLLRKHSASQISIYSFASPLFGIVAAWALRGDSLSPWLFVSAACVAVGIFIVNSDFGARIAQADPQLEN